MQIKFDVLSSERNLRKSIFHYFQSSLLKLILGELRPRSGDVFVNGNLSYASQEPWLFGGSVRDNILFGESYQEEKYTRVIKACALMEDFKQLSHGDKTLVGESGSTLSGGQSARINLARYIITLYFAHFQTTAFCRKKFCLDIFKVVTISA